MPASHPVGVSIVADAGGRVVVAAGVRRVSEGFGAVFYMGDPIDVVSSIQSGLCDVFVFSEAGWGALDVVPPDWGAVVTGRRRA